MEIDQPMCGSRELEFSIFCIENVASKASCRRTESICGADQADRYFARIYYPGV